MYHSASPAIIGTIVVLFLFAIMFGVIFRANMGHSGFRGGVVVVWLLLSCITIVLMALSNRANVKFVNESNAQLDALRNAGFDLTNATVIDNTVAFYAGRYQVAYTIVRTNGTYSIFSGNTPITPRMELASLKACASGKG